MADAHTKPHHDYHLVDPSPWPAVGAVSAFLMASGGIAWLHHMFVVAPYVFGVGVLGMAYTMIGWWRDVAREATHDGFHSRVVQISHRYGMILFIASEVMFFVAWFWAYFDAALFPADTHQIVREQLLGGQWPPKGIETFDPWHLPLLNTLILLTSGTTVTWAHHALLENDRQGLKWGLILTIALGITFTAVHERIKAGIARSFQIVNLFDGLSVFDNVALSIFSREGKIARIAALAEHDRDVRDETYDVLRQFGLESMSALLAGGLAQGERKLLDVAVAYALRPKLLFLDEPTSGVSTRDQTQIMDTVSSVVREGGVTAVVIEHDMDVVFRY